MIAVEFTQYLLPDGHTNSITMNVADDLRAHIDAIKGVGARLECEVLITGVVSLTVTDPEEGVDFDIYFVQNGPGVPKAVDHLIRRFTQEKYQAWRRELVTP